MSFDHDLPTDERQAEDVNTKAANAQKTMIADIKWLMSSPRGRRLVWWLLAITGIFRSSFNKDTAVTSFNEGARNVGLQLLAQVNDHCLNQYVEMLNEQEKRDE